MLIPRGRSGALPLVLALPHTSRQPSAGALPLVLALPHTSRQPSAGALLLYSLCPSPPSIYPRGMRARTCEFVQVTREAMLVWLSATLRLNAERSKIRPNLEKASSDGFMLNLCAVLLKLCEPFADPLAGKAWGKLDARCVGLAGTVGWGQEGGNCGCGCGYFPVNSIRGIISRLGAFTPAWILPFFRVLALV
jgi:hypothetical protein